MSDTTSDTEAASAPPEPVFLQNLQPSPAPSFDSARADEFELARNILRYIFYAGLTGTATLVIFAICAGGGWQSSGLRIGGLGLFAFAAVAAGAATGFLFGIPRTLQGNASAGSTSYQVNTNLEQISDWLTKIIVGLGLINLKSIPDRLMEMNRYVSETLGMRPPAYAAVGSAAVFFAMVGFLLGYLSTRLFISGAFRKADNDLLRTVGKEAEPFAKAGAQPRDPEPQNRPIDARVVKLLDLAEKTDATPSSVTPDVARQLARAFSASEEFQRAVPFFERAGARRGDDQDLALEYAYALGESGKRREAVAFLEDFYARKSSDDAARLLGYFFLWFPEHIDKAIDWTQLYLNKHPNDSGAYLNLACAYAQRYGRTSNDNDRRKAIELLQTAIKMNSGWRERARQLRHEDFAALSETDFAEAIRPTSKQTPPTP
jgi:tetratricopeptide (TPR) repeat protein